MNPGACILDAFGQQSRVMKSATGIEINHPFNHSDATGCDITESVSGVLSSTLPSISSSKLASILVVSICLFEGFLDFF